MQRKLVPCADTPKCFTCVNPSVLLTFCGRYSAIPPFYRWRNGDPRSWVTYPKVCIFMNLGFALWRLVVAFLAQFTSKLFSRSLFQQDPFFGLCFLSSDEIPGCFKIDSACAGLEDSFFKPLCLSNVGVPKRVHSMYVKRREPSGQSFGCILLIWLHLQHVAHVWTRCSLETVKSLSCRDQTVYPLKKKKWGEGLLWDDLRLSTLKLL